MAPKVYFTDFATRNYETLPKKLARLILTAGIDKIDFEGKFVAIKIHFGELGNMAHLRSGYAKVLVDIIKDLGGKPFLTDANTLYRGSRKNALDHIETAYLNGFTPYSTRIFNSHPFPFALEFDRYLPGLAMLRASNLIYLAFFYL